jgi:hypothetical protein
MTFAHLSDKDLHRLTRRALQERPTTPEAWQANIADLLALAEEVRARVSQNDSIDRRSTP